MKKIIFVCDKSFKYKNEFSYLFKNYNLVFTDINYLKAVTMKTHILLCTLKEEVFYTIEFEKKFFKILKNKSNVFLIKNRKLLFIHKNDSLLKNFNKTDTINELFTDAKDYDPLLFNKINIDDTNYWQIKSIYDNDFKNFYNNKLPIISINKFIKNNITEPFYTLIYIVNNSNFNILYNISKITYHNLRIFIFIQKIDIEKIDCLKMIITQNKNKIINYLFIKNNLNKIYNFITNNIIYFENLIFVKNNISNDDIKTISKNILIRKNIFINDYFVINSSVFCEMIFLSSKIINDYPYINYERLMINYLQSNHKNSSYINSIIKFDYFNIKFDILHNILFIIKNYNKLLELLNNELKKCYDSNTYYKLLIKKVTISILTNNESTINEQMASIFKYVVDDKLLSEIYTLFEHTKFNNIKRDILEKIVDKSDDDKSLSFLFRLFFINHDNTSIKKLLELIIKKIDLLKSKEIKKDNFIIHLTKCFLPFNKDDKLIELYNKILSEFYNVIDIKNIHSVFNNELNINNDIMINLILLIATNFSPYYKTFNEFIETRTNIYNNLMYIHDNIKHTVKLDDICSYSVGNFYLSYQGVSSVDIFKLKCKINRKLCPELNYKIDTNFKNNKIKILFHAQHLHRVHSVFKDRHQIIKNLAEDYDVYYSTFDELIEDVRFSFGKAKHILLPKNLSEIRDRISKEKFDIIVYCEIGMYPVSYYMAHLKLAKIQCNTWGHSDTSGIDSIDYFFSSELYETIEAQQNYSEKLILQKSLCTSYINPMSKYNKNNFKSREYFGFTNDVIIYFCAQSLFKLNPIYDEYIIGILKNVPNAVLILLENEEKYKLLERFNNKGIGHQIKFLQGMHHNGYMNLMYISDVFLDVYPFGGCNSSFEGFSLGKVIVTQPSNMINGRFTTGFYKKMNLEEYICNSKEEYVNFGIKLGIDIDYRKSIENKIIENNNCLFLDKESVQEWKDDIQKIYNLVTNE